MRLIILHHDWTCYHVFVNQIDQLLQDLTLKLEAREMAAVRENINDLCDNKSIERGVEDTANMWNCADSIIEVPHALQANFHYFRLFMLKSKDNCVDDCLEFFGVKLKHALSTMVDYVVHKFEEWLSKLREGYKIILNHFKSRLT